MRLWRIALLTIVLSTPVFASSWVKVTTSSTGTVVYMDASSLRKEDYRSTVWFRLDHSLDRTEKAHASKTLMAFDCQRHQISAISSVSYAISGAVLTSFTVPYGQEYWNPVVPDTVGEAQLTMACSYTATTNN